MELADGVRERCRGAGLTCAGDDDWQGLDRYGGYASCLSKSEASFELPGRTRPPLGFMLYIYTSHPPLLLVMSS
jgi:hypothetical protein